MKRILSHPSLPLVLGIIAILIAGFLLLGSYFFPNLFEVEAAGDKVQSVVSTAVSVVIPDTETEPTSSTNVSGSYVLDVRDLYLKEQKTFIEADLTNMNIKVYREGQVVIDVPIKSKGREGSWWETPVGVYSVKSKEPSHFSSFGHVYQPWSLVFQGNFFIHGWPYYPDGSPVSSQYSGGCIRLADENAKSIYDAVEVGTPVLVYKELKEAKPLPEFAGNPDISGDYAILDIPTGSTIRSREAGGVVGMGSSVDLLTALTTVDYLNVESNIAVSDLSSPRLRDMSRASVLDLLRLLLSEHDAAAAQTIAQARGEATFVRYMNAKASAIGMAHTVVHSVNANDPENKTTFGDVALLTRYLAQNRSFVLQLTKASRGNAIYDPPAWGDLAISRELLALPGFFGGVQESGNAPAVVVLTVTAGGKERDVAVAANSLAAVKEVAAWLSK